MRRFVLLLLPLLMLVAPGSVAAQSDAPRVYMMYFQVDNADLPTWIENHQQHEAPLLDSLVAEGLLETYDFWLHNTGGVYNVRYNLVVSNWNAIGEFMDAYFSRIDPGAMQEWGSLIQEHTDEIWVIGDSNIPGDASDAPMIYESSFHVAYGELEQWNADFEAYGKPAMDRAVEEGVIRGWANLQHDTGGPWNVRTIYWLDSWDDADDALMRIGQLRQELGQGMGNAGMIRSHADEVWMALPGSGN